jgi:phosphoglycolate phosphatase-like HAD superfamily hydrolase
LNKDPVDSDEINEQDYRPYIAEDISTHFLTGTGIEIVRDLDHPEPPQHVLFDFDGTVSLIRQGWQDVMVPLMVEEIFAASKTVETEEELKRSIRDSVDYLTGKQTIYQMIHLADEIRKRGGKPEDPLVYKHRYLERLMKRIAERREGLRSGRINPAEMLVPYTIEMLEALKLRGVQLYLASGTDEKYVLEEARLLRVDRYFGAHIYGAQDAYLTFSKKMVIERILKINSIDGSRLLGFGDGYVEIENIKSVGGLAVAVASDEAGRSGAPDDWKRRRLIGIGADIVIPDYRDYDVLLRYVWNESEVTSNAL